MWHMVRTDGEYVIVHTPGVSKSKDAKDAVGATMRTLFMRHDIVRYLFISEACAFDTTGMGQAETDRALKWIAEHSNSSVEDYPERVEVVMFSGEDHEAGQMQAHRAIVRATERKPTLAPLRYLDLTGWEWKGRLAGMLPRKGTVQ
jgi:hypothetical protein